MEAILGTVFDAGRAVGAIVPVETGKPTVGAIEIVGANVAVGKLVGYTASKPIIAVEFTVIIVLMDPTMLTELVVAVAVSNRRLWADEEALGVLQLHDVYNAEYSSVLQASSTIPEEGDSRAQIGAVLKCGHCELT
jgi:hypothetical protein